MILMGAIIAAHGLKGEVKVKSFAASPRDIAAYGPLFDAAGKARFALDLSGRGSGSDVLIARIAGCETRDAAEALVGQELFLPRALLPAKTEDEEFYLADLVGLAVFDSAGMALGRVRSAADYGAGDVLDIAGGPKGDFAIPFARRFVPVIDLAARRLVVDLPADFFAPLEKPENAGGAA